MYFQEGSPTTAVAIPPATKKKYDKTMVIVLGTSALVLIALGAYYLITKSKKKSLTNSSTTNTNTTTYSSKKTSSSSLKPIVNNATNPIVILMVRPNLKLVSLEGTDIGTIYNISFVFTTNSITITTRTTTSTTVSEESRTTDYIMFADYVYVLLESSTNKRVQFSIKDNKLLATYFDAQNPTTGVAYNLIPS